MSANVLKIKTPLPFVSHATKLRPQHKDTIAFRFECHESGYYDCRNNYYFQLISDIIRGIQLAGRYEQGQSTATREVHLQTWKKVEELGKKRGRHKIACIIQDGQSPQ